jgi:perosamine synthetase
MKIPHNCPTIGFREILSTARTIHSGWIADGPQVVAFEQELCEFLNLPHGHAVCVSSGTAALALALWACGAKNKKVAIPVYACASLRHAIAFAGGHEVLIDIENNSPNIDIEIVNRQKPDIVIVPHMFGIPVNVRKLIPSIRVIEDCAQSIGAHLSKQSVGTIGDVGIFSFYATKLFTAGGQGGAVVSRNKDLIDMIKDYREFDCRRDYKIRFNFKLPDTLASFGRVQLKRLPGFLRRREELFQEYRKYGLPLIGAEIDSEEVKPVRYRAIVNTPYAQKLITKLSESDVKAIIPIEKWELLCDSAEYYRANEFCNNTVSIPLYPKLTLKNVHFIAKRSLSIL